MLIYTGKNDAAVTYIMRFSLTGMIDYDAGRQLGKGNLQDKENTNMLSVFN